MSSALSHHQLVVCLVCMLLLAGCFSTEGHLHRRVQKHKQPSSSTVRASPPPSTPSANSEEGMSLPPIFHQLWSAEFPAQWGQYLQQLEALHLPGKTLKAAKALVYNSTLLNPTQLQRSLAYRGCLNRLRRVVQDLLAGMPVKVAVIGGSISWGTATERGTNDWFSRVLAQLKTAFPSAQITGRNGCVPATPSSFMSVCLEHYLDADADLIFVEYATNDGWHTSDDKQAPRAYERLLRKLLSKPRSPAVVLLQLPTKGQAYSNEHPYKRWFADTLEDTYGGIAAYYDLPYLSMRNAIWRLAQFHQYQMNFSDWFGNFDHVHPVADGHHSIAGMVSWLLHQVVLDLAAHPYSKLDAAEVALPLMEPMHPGNYEEINKLCIHGKELTEQVAGHEGWNMINEGDETKAKWGFVTRQAGSVLRILVNTTCSSSTSYSTSTTTSNSTSNRTSTSNSNSTSSHHGCTAVQLAYLRSYHGMGRALVRCSSGCTCPATTMEGHHSSKTSTIFLLPLQPSPAPKCEISVTVLEDTNSGGHKVKITGVMATEVRSSDEHWETGEAVLNREEWLWGVNKAN